MKTSDVLMAFGVQALPNGIVAVSFSVVRNAAMATTTVE